jgi:hypothetical protein
MKNFKVAEKKRMKGGMQAEVIEAKPRRIGFCFKGH